jgi:hypothetical protein
MSKSHQGFSNDTIHPVGFFCEDVDDQLLVLRCPSYVFWMCVDDRLDIVLDVSLLSSLVMKGDIERNQGIEDILDITFRSTCDTYMQIRGLQLDKFLYEVQDFGTGRSDGRKVWAFIQSIHNEVHGGESRELK